MSSRGHASDKMKYVPDSLRWLIAITGVLIVIGCLNIYSSTYYMDIYDGGSAYKHISNHILFLLGGILQPGLLLNWERIKFSKVLGFGLLRYFCFLFLLNLRELVLMVRIAGLCWAPCHCSLRNWRKLRELSGRLLFWRNGSRIKSPLQFFMVY